jgi:hypothetical protein
MLFSESIVNVAIFLPLPLMTSGPHIHHSGGAQRQAKSTRFWRAFVEHHEPRARVAGTGMEEGPGRPDRGTAPSCSNQVERRAVIRRACRSQCRLMASTIPHTVMMCKSRIDNVTPYMKGCGRPCIPQTGGSSGADPIRSRFIRWNSHALSIKYERGYCWS